MRTDMKTAMKYQGWGQARKYKAGCVGKGGRRRHKLRLVVVSVLVMLVALGVVVDAALRPIVQTVAAQQVHLAVVRLINEAVYDQLGNGVAYQQLINVSTDENGRVTLMQPDTVKITRLVTSVARDLEEKISGLSRSDIRVPLGLLTGNLLLADKGPNLTVALLPLGSVSVNIHDEFSEAGINQTKHSIMLDIVVDMGILMPFQSTFTEITDTLPIVESVIVGPIPETYLDFKASTDSLSEGGEVALPYLLNKD
jgi:sporulation protein YunB